MWEKRAGTADQPMQIANRSNPRRARLARVWVCRRYDPDGSLSGVDGGDPRQEMSMALAPLGMGDPPKAYLIREIRNARGDQLSREAAIQPAVVRQAGARKRRPDAASRRTPLRADSLEREAWITRSAPAATPHLDRL